MGIGVLFKTTRLNVGLSLSDVEDETKIRSKYLEAIEKEDFEVIPGKVYLKGFIKTYAKFLEIENNEEILRFLEENSSPTVSNLEPPSEFKQKGVFLKSLQKRHITLIFGICAILILFGVQHIYNNNFNKKVIPPSDLGVKPNIPIEEPIIKEPTPLPIEEPETLRLIIEILDLTTAKETCWVRVYSDNTLFYEGTMNEGETKTIEAQEKIKIKLGNAGVAKLTLGNTELGLIGKVGQIAEKEFTLTDLKENPL